MYPIWFIDHFLLVTLLIIALAGVVAFGIYRYSLGVPDQHPAKSQVAAFGVQLTNLVLVSLLLNHLWGAVRDRDERQWALRQNHLVKLQSVLLADSVKLGFIARQATEVGRISNLNNGTATDMVELESFFSPEILTPDLANHYQEYWQEKQRLLEDIQQQDASFGDTVARVSKPVYLPVHAENRRVTVGQAVLARCLGKGPGIAVEKYKYGGYSYRILQGGGSDTAGDVPQDVIEILEAFQSISPDAETIKSCESLRKGAASIATKASALARKAKLLAESSVLRGNCEYTKLD